MKLLTTLFLFIISSTIYAQDLQLKYFAKPSVFSKEVKQEKAKFCQRITSSDDEVIKTDFIDLKTNEIIESTSFKDDEPCWNLEIQKSL